MTLPRAVVRTTGVSTAGGGGVGGCSVGGCALACASTHCCSLSARSCNGDVSAGTSTDGAMSGRFSDVSSRCRRFLRYSRPSRLMMYDRG